jgi:hypothetical protein
MPTPVPEPDPNPLCGADPLARALARLQPMPAGVDGQKLLYLAGQAARERTVALWQRLFVGQCVLLVALGGIAVVHFTQPDAADRSTTRGNTTITTPTPKPDPIGPQKMTDDPTPEYAPEPREAQESPAYSPALYTRTDGPPDDLSEYLRVRREVLTAGLGLLPDTKPQPAAPVNPAELERRLHLPPGVLTAPYRAPEPKKPE